MYIMRAWVVALQETAGLVIYPSIRPQISRVREGNFVVCVAVTTHGLNRPKIGDPDLVIVSLNAPPISFSINPSSLYYCYANAPCCAELAI